MQGSEERLMESPRLRFHLNVHDPIELIEMTKAFQGLSYEFQSHLKTYGLSEFDKKNDVVAKNIDEVKLYVTKIESNCILAEVAPALPLMAPVVPIISDVNQIVDFVKNCKETIDWLRRFSSMENIFGIEPKDIPYTKKNLKQVKDLVNIIANSEKGDLGLEAIEYQEDTGDDKVALSIRFKSDECRQAANGADAAIKVLENKGAADHEGVLMFFHQTNRDDPKAGGQTGDKALISRIDAKPKKVYIISELDQQRVRSVLDDKDHNPLLTGFMVDVNVEYNPAGKPMAYRVMNVHDVVYDDEE